jgi:hypothetical protein
MFNTPHHVLQKSRVISSVVRCFRTPGILKLFTIVSPVSTFSSCCLFLRGQQEDQSSIIIIIIIIVAVTVYPKAKWLSPSTRKQKRLVICFWQYSTIEFLDTQPRLRSTPRLVFLNRHYFCTRSRLPLPDRHHNEKRRIV